MELKDKVVVVTGAAQAWGVNSRWAAQKTE